MPTDNEIQLFYNFVNTETRSGFECPADCDCDCDCPPSLALANPVLGLSKPNDLYIRSHDLTVIQLTKDYYVVANPSVRPGIVLINSKIHALLSDYQEPKILLGHGEDKTEKLLSLVRARLLVPYVPTQQYSGFSDLEASKSLIAWLHITNACPLSCKYCYVNKTSDSMSSDIGQRAINTIFSQASKHGYDNVKLKYAGGEPSLNLDLVELLHRLGIQRAWDHGIEFDEVFMTSGAMSDRARQRIIDMDIRAMISLDALNSDHDFQRPLLSGKPSNTMTRDTLQVMKDAGVDVCVSITVTRQSANTLIELIDFLLNLDVPFSINYARDNAFFIDRDIFKPQNKLLIETMKQVIAHLGQNPPKRSLLGSLVDRANLSGPHTYTCAVGRNYLVIDHLGRISMCQQEMQTPITTIYEPNPLIKIINNEIGIKNLSVHEKEGCRTCEWRYWCTGGCAVLTTQVYGRANVRSPFCDVYKAIFPEVVRLEGLRLLLKMQNDLSKLHEGPFVL